MVEVVVSWNGVRKEDVKKVKNLIDKMICDFVDGGGLEDFDELEFDVCECSVEVKD